MFENLTDKLGNVFKGLTKRGALSEGDVDTALKAVSYTHLTLPTNREV